MERHDTHLLSCSSSVEHSYRFDKNGMIISDSTNNFAYNKYVDKKKNKIKTSELISNMPNEGIESSNDIFNGSNDQNNTISCFELNKKENKVIIEQSKKLIKNIEIKNKDNNLIISKDNKDNNLSELYIEKKISEKENNNKNKNNSKKNIIKKKQQRYDNNIKQEIQSFQYIQNKQKNEFKQNLKDSKMNNGCIILNKINEPEINKNDENSNNYNNIEKYNNLKNKDENNKNLNNNERYEERYNNLNNDNRNETEYKNKNTKLDLLNNEQNGINNPNEKTKKPKSYDLSIQIKISDSKNIIKPKKNDEMYLKNINNHINKSQIIKKTNNAVSQTDEYVLEIICQEYFTLATKTKNTSPAKKKNLIYDNKFNERMKFSSKADPNYLISFNNNPFNAQNKEDKDKKGIIEYKEELIEKLLVNNPILLPMLKTCCYEKSPLINLNKLHDNDEKQKEAEKQKEIERKKEELRIKYKEKSIEKISKERQILLPNNDVCYYEKSGLIKIEDKILINLYSVKNCYCFFTKQVINNIDYENQMILRNREKVNKNNQIGKINENIAIINNKEEIENHQLKNSKDSNSNLLCSVINCNYFVTKQEINNKDYTKQILLRNKEKINKNNKIGKVKESVVIINDKEKIINTNYKIKDNDETKENNNNFGKKIDLITKSKLPEKNDNNYDNDFEMPLNPNINMYINNDSTEMKNDQNKNKNLIINKDDNNENYKNNDFSNLDSNYLDLLNELDNNIKEQNECKKKIITHSNSNNNINKNTKKPINILKTKNKNSNMNNNPSLQTAKELPNIYNRQESSDNNNIYNNNYHRINSTSKIRRFEGNGTMSPEILNQKLFKKKLFNNTNATTTTTKTEKKFRNLSALNVGNTGSDYTDSHKKNENNSPSPSDYEIGNTMKHTKHIYGRHFGKEENCPLCKAVRLRGKINEEKKLLPLLTKKNLKDITNKNKLSPNKCSNVVHNKDSLINPIRLKSGLIGMIKNNRTNSVGPIKKQINLTNHDTKKGNNNDDDYTSNQNFF